METAAVWVGRAGDVMEIAGVAVVPMAAITSAFPAVESWRAGGRESAYRSYRQAPGRAMSVPSPAALRTPKPMFIELENSVPLLLQRESRHPGTHVSALRRRAR